MSRLIDLKSVPLRQFVVTGLQGCFLILILLGCQKLKPEDVEIPEYPNFEELIKQQVPLLGKTTIKKTVSLEGQSEEQVVQMDTTKWKNELDFLKEINPNQPEYIGAFTKEQNGNQTVLTLGPEEKGELKNVRYVKIGDIYSAINATFHEDKDVYVHHRDISIDFRDGLIQSIEINGYQKMMFKDTVRFGISISTALDK
ncbi:hypothetical protein [Ekhidna sp.]|uniref:hypothetical protein n=1 Tax=Ekhidna sp. TaxID=2608089 RepID=UPI003CCBA4B1